ncbi:DNA-binding transcriptional ArsR family regulator [Crossiella equi]|uniref:DNA-binding transcriptional ArsR family regulator n=1 Tax=Crossiella equi TaxID=130796 RepID=A0ABS5ASG5_9PSEU|nr:winged helix-turn-helix domain-containing protein [Crossiella equi]MBP2479337.1 DNA-binding transcriptional ArsR family regulator [Crossiella equi]
MTSGLGPVAEGVFALDTFGRAAGTAVEPWRRRAAVALGGQLGEVHRLLHEVRPVPGLLWLLERQGPVTGRQAGTVFAFVRAAILPHWNTLHSRLEAERETRGRLAINSGVESVLATLHPRVRWNPPHLELLDEPDGEIDLAGEGMLLSPSAFLAEGSVAVLRTQKDGGQPALVFPAPGVLAALGQRGEEPTTGEQLGALVGATRAAALAALTESCTTGTLSQRLGISLAGASKHATVLRKAGLVTTTRNRNTALHTLTSLGMALLQGQNGTAPQRERAAVC